MKSQLHTTVPQALPAGPFFRRWVIINATCNLGGLIGLFVLVAISDLVKLEELGKMALSVLVCFPIVPLLVSFLAVPRLLRFTGLLKRMDKGETLASEALDWARRFYFGGPRWVAGTALCAWVFLGVGSFLLNWHWHQLPLPLSLAMLLELTLFAGPLAAVMTLFAGDVHIRSQAWRLFPDGRLSKAHGRSIPLPLRVAIVLLFGVVLPQIGIAAILLDRGKKLLLSPDPQSSFESMSMLAMAVTSTNILLMAAFVVLMGRAVALPMYRMTKAMHRVEQGELEVRVPVESNDLVGYVSERFNAMVEGVREREFLRQVFGRYVSADVANEVLNGKLELGGERRVVTVLFSDIRDFTGISEKLTPRELVELLNRYFSRMVGCVVAQGGMVNKFIGDGIMAIFGAPVPRVDQADRAIRTAFEMLRELESFNEEQRARDGLEFRIGIGIATGEVVVGNVGSEDRIEYTAIGDTVNTASRIEGLTKELGVPILLDQATFHASRGQMALESLGARRVKGKADPVPVFGPALLSPIAADSACQEA